MSDLGFSKLTHRSLSALLHTIFMKKKFIVSFLIYEHVFNEQDFHEKEIKNENMNFFLVTFVNGADAWILEQLKFQVVKHNAHYQSVEESNYQDVFHLYKTYSKRI